jgi:hypothetical protein
MKARVEREMKGPAGGVLEAGAGVGGEQEGGQVDGEQAEDEPEQFHGRSRFLSGCTSDAPRCIWGAVGLDERRIITVNLRYNPLYYTILNPSI